MHAAGTVVRCRTCESVLMTVVRGNGRTWLGVDGIRVLELEL
jgi:hypothetical protein